MASSTLRPNLTLHSLGRRRSSFALLPLSASPSSPGFPSPPTTKSSTTPGLLTLLCAFPLSTALVFLALRSLPISFHWPHTLADVSQLGGQLHAYAQSGKSQMVHVLAVISLTTVWKHAWSIPGSVIWNVLAGTLLNPLLSTLLLTTLTALGSLSATLLSMPFAPLLSSFFPSALHITRSALQGTASPSWVRLTVLRLVGLVPWSAINIASGVCNVNLVHCLLAAFVGSLPWTAVTCQIGSILHTLSTASPSSQQSIQSLLLSPSILFKLVSLTFLSLAPILAKDYLTRWVTNGTSSFISAPTGPDVPVMEMHHLRDKRADSLPHAQDDSAICDDDEIDHDEYYYSRPLGHSRSRPSRSQSRSGAPSSSRISLLSISHSRTSTSSSSATSSVDELLTPTASEWDANSAHFLSEEPDEYQSDNDYDSRYGYTGGYDDDVAPPTPRIGGDIRVAGDDVLQEQGTSKKWNGVIPIRIPSIPSIPSPPMMKGKLKMPRSLGISFLVPPEKQRKDRSRSRTTSRVRGMRSPWRWFVADEGDEDVAQVGGRS